MIPDSAAAIEEAFVAKVKDVEGVTTAEDHEPMDIGRLPCVTMLYLGFEADDSELGSGADVMWEWDVFVYVDLRDWRAGQRETRDLVSRLALLHKADRKLDGTCDDWKLLDPREPPEMGREEGIMLKRLRLQAWTRESV